MRGKMSAKVAKHANFKSYDLKQQIIKVTVQSDCFRLVEFSTALFYVTFDV